MIDLRVVVFAFLADAHFAHMNSDGRGIKSGLHTCICDDLLQCTCGINSFLQVGNDVSGTTREARGKLRNRNDIVVSGARKGLPWHFLFHINHEY